MCVGAGVYGKSLYLPLSCAVCLYLLLKFKALKEGNTTVNFVDPEVVDTDASEITSKVLPLNITISGKEVEKVEEIETTTEVEVETKTEEVEVKETETTKEETGIMNTITRVFKSIFKLFKSIKLK